MKKVLSLAIAAVVAAPMAAMADTTVYGLIDNALVHTDTGSNDSWDVENGNGSSRFGVKVSEDLGNGMKAIGQYEWAVDSSDDACVGGCEAAPGRLAFVGLTGGFGTVAIGRQWFPYYGSVAKTNIMNVGGLHSYYLGVTRTGNAVAYVSPDFSGFSVKAAMIADGTSGDDSVDGTNISLDYNNGPLSVGVSILDYSDETSSTGDRWGLGAKYNFGSFALMGMYEDQDDANADSFALGAEAYFGNNTVKFVYGEKEVGTTETEEWAIGLQHNFSKRTRAYVEYGQEDANGTDEDTFGIGLRHDF